MFISLLVLFNKQVNKTSVQAVSIFLLSFNASQAFYLFHIFLYFKLIN